MVSEKIKKEALEEWIYTIRGYAFEIVEETEQKSDANLKQIKNKAQEIVDFIMDLEEHELKEA